MATITPSPTAVLLVVDIQNDFCPDAALAAFEAGAIPLRESADFAT